MEDKSITLKEGMDLAGFTLIRQIGEGGMGEVWLAEQKSMSRTVALKILDPNLDTKGDFTSRFLKEVQISAKLNHQNIVTAHDAGEVDGLHFLAMTYVEGKPLDDILYEQTTLSEKESLQIARSISEALDYAWSEFKILHRDIKPSNIIIDNRGTPQLLDMGISKCLTEDTSITVTGFMLGTPCYISPEQVVGEKDIDCRTDIYSLGVLLYHMLTGDTPFQGGTAIQIAMQHIHENPPDIQNKNQEVSDQCSTLIQKMMAKKREFRQKNWKELINDIELVLDGKFPADTEVEENVESEEHEEAVPDVKATKIKPRPELPFKMSEPEPKTEPEKEDISREQAVQARKNPVKRTKVAVSIFLLVIVLALLIFLYFSRKDQGEPVSVREIKKSIKKEPKQIEETSLDVNPVKDNSGTIDTRKDSGDQLEWLLKKSKAELDEDRDRELDAHEAELDKKMTEEKKKLKEVNINPLPDDTQ